MIQRFPAEGRYRTNHGWLRSSFSFSFAEYYDPHNLQFGPMRVLNDDWIAPGTGFGMHPHKEMEIVTVVLSGRLQHRDSIGNAAQTGWGGIQRMSAGTGIFHSEHNASKDEPLELLQMWFIPEKNGLTPSYETTQFDTASLQDRLVPVVSGDEHVAEAGKVARIHQDMTIYLAEPRNGATLTHTQPEGRRVFLFVIEGGIRLGDGTVLKRRDSARIENEPELALTAEADGSRIMLIDLP
ncbi:pirin family protein [Paenibacillus cisolokensis]|uniref:Quercetin 2,3-dioxygenase n=1 Tax=Paenibacillus cisolokensis TaxID=1658519 RepID=A0ABQ4N9F1_9BACL|nr:MULTISPECIES: pirin family protein [Paenibacillus]ALS26795.1 quercetin 2,3-dioxygenase [Paenibacillus sp. 32O-W]GIQ64852.1 quercetin 2,3-dioxygenase [Paenibacillus cisolokensis]